MLMLLLNYHIHVDIISIIVQKEFDIVIRSMKGRQTALPSFAQISLKQACDFFQFILATGKNMKDQYLTHDSIKSHAIQFQAFKDTDSKEVGGLPKLSIATDVLSWMDRMEKHLRIEVTMITRIAIIHN